MLKLQLEVLLLSCSSLHPLALFCSLWLEDPAELLDADYRPFLYPRINTAGEETPQEQGCLPITTPYSKARTKETGEAQLSSSHGMHSKVSEP